MVVVVAVVVVVVVKERADERPLQDVACTHSVGGSWGRMSGDDGVGAVKETERGGRDPITPPP